MPTPPKLGATGRFPHGKLNPHDKGELLGSVVIEGKQVRLNFGNVPVTWVSLPPDTARHLAMLLLDKADKIDGGATV